MASFGAFLTYLFSLPQEEEKDEVLNTLTNSDFISKCTQYIIIIHLLHVDFSLQI